MSDETPKPQLVVADSGGTSLEFLASAQVTVPLMVEKRIEHEPLPDGHPIFAMVGLVASEFARLEHTLDETIWDLAGLESPRGASITAQLMGVGPRCLTIIALHAQRGLPEETRRRKISSFMDQAHRLSDKRNRLIHDPWFLDTGTNSASQLKSMPRKELIYEYKIVTADYVTEVISEIRQFIARAIALHEQVLSELRTSS